MTTMLGRHAMYVTSNAPQCVAPSAPTRPARSIANRTACARKEKRNIGEGCRAGASRGHSLAGRRHATVPRQAPHAAIASPPYHGNRTWQVLQRHIMHHLVVAALQEGGVDGHKRRQPLAGKACCKCDRVLLCDAHVVHALGEHLRKRRWVAGGYLVERTWSLKGIAKGGSAAAEGTSLQRGTGLPSRTGSCQCRHPWQHGCPQCARPSWPPPPTRRQNSWCRIVTAGRGPGLSLGNCGTPACNHCVSLA